MTSIQLRRGALLLSLLAGAVSYAQERGRTDGPEGSEYGKGGYQRPSGALGRFSLGLDFGAAASNAPSASLGVPLLVGLTASGWFDDWFVLDAGAIYNFNQSRVQVSVGPRFRTIFWPVSLYAGVKAGPVFGPSGIRFAISPVVGADMVVGEHLVAGLAYAYDIVFGEDDTHRAFMTIGYRF